MGGCASGSDGRLELFCIFIALLWRVPLNFAYSQPSPRSRLSFRGRSIRVRECLQQVLSLATCQMRGMRKLTAGNIAESPLPLARYIDSTL